MYLCDMAIACMDHGMEGASSIGKGSVIAASRSA